MIVLYITSLNLKGHYQEYSIGHSDFDTCFDMLSKLANSTHQLLHVELSVYKDHSMTLPPEAFDGEPLGEIFRVLQSEWETILYQKK